MPSQSMRMTLATLELASGSEAPRPTTSSSVSSSATLAGCRGNGLGDTVAGGAQHLEIDAEFAAVGDLELRMFRRVGVEHRRDVVLGVAGGEQHAGDGEDAFQPWARSWSRPWWITGSANSR